MGVRQLRGNAGLFGFVGAARELPTLFRGCRHSGECRNPELMSFLSALIFRRGGPLYSSAP